MTPHRFYKIAIFEMVDIKLKIKYTSKSVRKFILVVFLLLTARLHVR